MPAELEAFIEGAKKAGASDSFIATLLEESGWPKKDIWLAFSEHYAQMTGMPVPKRPSGVESAKDAFFYLLSFSTLATWAWALGSMLFTFIDRWFLDSVYSNRDLNTEYNLASEMASIFVAFPLYFAVMRMIVNGAERNPEKLESGVRKWLTYLALLIAAGCIIGDLITFVNYFLRGEITERFFFKVLVVLVIASGVFGYYLGSLRGYNSVRNKIYSGAAALAAMGVITIGFLHLGPPSNQRLLEADRRRVIDLRNISLRINSSKKVPVSLSAIGLTFKDPITQIPYEFRAQEDDQYELCATFAAQDTYAPNEFWDHPAGRKCFAMNLAVNH